MTQQRIANKLIKIKHTTDDVKSTKSDEGEDVEWFPISFVPQLIHQFAALPAEHFHKVIQDREVEGGSEEFATRTPLAS